MLIVVNWLVEHSSISRLNKPVMLSDESWFLEQIKAVSDDKLLASNAVI
jgi:hypothetical protein